MDSISNWFIPVTFLYNVFFRTGQLHFKSNNDKKWEINKCVLNNLKRILYVQLRYLNVFYVCQWINKNK